MIEVVLTSYICLPEGCQLLVDVLEGLTDCDIIDMFIPGMLEKVEEGSWFRCEVRE